MLITPAVHAAPAPSVTSTQQASADKEVPDASEKQDAKDTPDANEAKETNKTDTDGPNGPNVEQTGQNETAN